MKKSLPMKSPITRENVARYVVEKIVVESDLEHSLRLETAKLPEAGMISGSDVGAFLQILIRSIGARRALEIGTFTGYTALKMASALPSDGQIVCCDISAEWAEIGRPFWEKAGVATKIDLRVAPALETLNDLLRETGSGSFDFAFIDADKTAYHEYYEACLRLVRPNGLIILDNMLWSGTVVDPSIQDPTTNAIRDLNDKISRDPRVESCLLTVGDGLMMVRIKNTTVLS